MATAGQAVRGEATFGDSLAWRLAPDPGNSSRPARLWPGLAAALALHSLVGAVISLWPAQPASAPMATVAVDIVMESVPPAPMAGPPGAQAASDDASAQDEQQVREAPAEPVAETAAKSPPPPPPAPPRPIHHARPVSAQAKPVRVTASHPAPVPQQGTAPGSVAEAAEAPLIPPSGHAGYRDNPPPAYPAAARRRGVQGVVLLSVAVASDGLARTVSVRQSSGSDLLDEAAIAAVQRWRFVPATRAGHPVDADVDVPIRFALSGG